MGAAATVKLTGKVTVPDEVLAVTVPLYVPAVRPAGCMLTKTLLDPTDGNSQF